MLEVDQEKELSRIVINGKSIENRSLKRLELKMSKKDKKLLKDKTSNIGIARVIIHLLKHQIVLTERKNRKRSKRNTQCTMKKKKVMKMMSWPI